MSGEEQLERLLKSMSPVLNEGTYVFCSLGSPAAEDLESAVGTFREEEGTTLILEKSYAKSKGIDWTFESQWITLQVHSALEAVGLTAAVAKAMTDHNISCNVVAGYYHDHLFVPKGQGAQVVQILEELSQNA